MPEIVKDYKGVNSRVKFSDLEDFIDRNTPGKIIYGADAVTEALTRNNNQLFDKLADIDAVGNEERNELDPIEKRELSLERITSMLNDEIKDLGVRQVLQHLADNFARIKAASKSGKDGITLADIKAYPAVALEERRSEGLARRLDFYLEDVCKKKPAVPQQGQPVAKQGQPAAKQAAAQFERAPFVSRADLGQQLSELTKSNRSKDLLGLDSEANKERQRLLEDLLDNNSFINDSSLLRGGISADVANEFLRTHTGLQSDRRDYIELHLPAQTADARATSRYTYSETGLESLSKVIAEKGTANEKVYEKFVDGFWYYVPKEGKPVKMEKPFKIDRYSHSISW